MRVALTEPFWRRLTDSEFVAFAQNYNVYVYKRGTAEEATLWTAAEGGAEVEQPLKTDESGRVLGPGGEFVWAAFGHFDIVAGGERVPWTDAEPGEGGGEGGVSSVNGDTGPAVELSAADVGAATPAEVSAEGTAREVADSAHAADTTAIHGIADTSSLATKAEVAARQDAATAATDAELAAHEADTTSVHGIADTSALATKTFVETADGLLVPKSLVDAKGDLFAGTADNTVGRVAVGSDGQVLTADAASGAGVKWATPSSSAGSGLPAARFATATALAANTRSGNVLEANANGVLSVDGGSPAEGNLILAKNEATGANNGLFKVLAPGAAGSKWKLERASAMDSSEDCVAGMLITVAEGDVNADSTWQLTTNATITLNTTALAFLPTRGPAIGCSVRRTTSLTVPDSTATKMPWTDAGGTLGFNIGGCWSSENATRLVFPIPGLYSVMGSCMYDDENVTTGERSIFIVLNGGANNTIFQNQHSYSGRNGRALGFAIQYRCTTAGEYCEVGYYQDSGSSRKIEPDQYGTGFEICRATLERIR